MFCHWIFCYQITCCWLIDWVLTCHKHPINQRAIASHVVYTIVFPHRLLDSIESSSRSQGTSSRVYRITYLFILVVVPSNDVVWQSLHILTSNDWMDSSRRLILRLIRCYCVVIIWYCNTWSVIHLPTFCNIMNLKVTDRRVFRVIIMLLSNVHLTMWYVNCLKKCKSNKTTQCFKIICN